MPFFRDFDPLKEFEKFFEEDWVPMFPALKRKLAPAADVYQTDTDVVVELDLPGIDPNNVEITIEDQTLKVSGGEDFEEEEKGKDYYRKEIRKGTFSRVIGLPERVKEEEARAEYKDGILKITIPKLEPKKPAKKVKVEVKK